MIVFPREVKTGSDLTPGALFGVSIRDETHLAVKIQSSGDEFQCAVLTGLPPHYVRENVVQNSLLKRRALEAVAEVKQCIDRLLHP